MSNTFKPRQLASHLFMTSENGYEAQRTNNFEFQVIGLDTIVNAAPGSEGTATNGYSQAVFNKLRDADTLVLSVKSGFTPKENVSSLSIAYGNSHVKYAGIPTYDDGNIVWNDYYDKDTELVLKAWQAAAYNSRTGAVGDAKNYKRTAYMTMFSPSGSTIRRWKLFGCWVSTVNGDDVSNDNNAIRTLSATFVFDYAVRLEDFTDDTSGI